jgi:hypothetical protein
MRTLSALQIDGSMDRSRSRISRPTVTPRTGAFTPVRAKLSKSFSLVDAAQVGLDRIQRNFWPLAQHIESARNRSLMNEDPFRSSFCPMSRPLPRLAIGAVNFLALSDDFSARTASELCGKEEQLKLSYSLSENDQDARVSVLTGRATAHKATISTSKSYNLQRDWVFEPKVFSELKNAQSIVLAYDGVNPLPASYCYLKPYYLDPNKSYFMQLADGEI